MSDDVFIRPAQAGDLPAIVALLAGAGLPPAGVEQWLPRFVVAERAGAVVAAAGLEIYGRAALLRSVVVAVEGRGRGLGAALTERIATEAARAGARMLYLLTTTAPAYFPRLGFRTIERAELPEALAASEELKGACPASAIVMARPLSGRA
ncbi:MAG TPA: arsenic resistance N-acetyltransferase ArsN2 [Longimicrobiales bacterium]